MIRKLLWTVAAIMAIVAFISMGACVKSPSHEDKICTHIANLLGQKELPSLHEACIQVLINTERQAESKGNGKKYRSYLECLENTSTYDEALYCRKVTGWNAQ